MASNYDVHFTPCIWKKDLYFMIKGTSDRIDHLHISDLILKLHIFVDYFPLMWEKVSISCKAQQKITYLFPILCIKFNCCRNNLWIFYLLYNYPLIFYKVRISTSFKENYTNLFAFPLLLHRTETIIPTLKWIRRSRRSKLTRNHQYLIWTTLISISIIS